MYDILTPWTIDGPRDKIDACRTLALMLISGIKASGKGPGLQMRRFAKILSESHYSEDVFYIIEYYLDYWSQFVNCNIDLTALMRAARLEIERFINIKISKDFSFPHPKEETTEAYLNRLAYSHSIDICVLRKAILT